MVIIKVTAEAEQWGNRGSLSRLLFVCWALRCTCAPLSAQTHSSATCQQGKAMAVGLESWCIWKDWKTRACLVLKGENLRGPYCCSTLHGCHEEGAEVSVGCGQWVDFTGKQKGAQRKGFLLLRAVSPGGAPWKGASGRLRLKIRIRTEALRGIPLWSLIWRLNKEISTTHEILHYSFDLCNPFLLLAAKGSTSCWPWVSLLPSLIEVIVFS